MSRNGELNPSELTEIQGQYLASGSANAFTRMSDAAWAARHIRLKISAGGAYRDLAAQQYLIDHPEGPVPIAPLGHSSHGLGTAVDIGNWFNIIGWLRAHATEFGFTQQFESEPWHWRHDGTTAGGAGVQITSRKRKAMEFRVIKETGLGVVYGETTFTEINPATDPKEFAASESAHGAGADRMFLTADQWRIEKIQIVKRRAQLATASVTPGKLMVSLTGTATPA